VAYWCSIEYSTLFLFLYLCYTSTSTGDRWRGWVASSRRAASCGSTIRSRQDAHHAHAGRGPFFISKFGLFC